MIFIALMNFEYKNTVSFPNWVDLGYHYICTIVTTSNAVSMYHKLNNNKT